MGDSAVLRVTLDSCKTRHEANSSDDTQQWVMFFVLGSLVGFARSKMSDLALNFNSTAIMAPLCADIGRRLLGSELYQLGHKSQKILKRCDYRRHEKTSRMNGVRLGACCQQECRRHRAPFDHRHACRAVPIIHNDRQTFNARRTPIPGICQHKLHKGFSNFPAK